MGNFANELSFTVYEDVNIYKIESWVNMCDDGCEDIVELEEALEPLRDPIEFGADEEIIEFALNEIGFYLGSSIKSMEWHYYEVEDCGLYNIVVAYIY